MSPLPADDELYDPSYNINRGSDGAQEWHPKNERNLTTDFHLEHHEIHMYERTHDFHRDIFCNPNKTPDQLIRQLRMHGSRNHGIMIELIEDYLWHDAHAVSEIIERLIKLLGLIRQEIVGTPGSPILSGRPSMIAALRLSANTSLSMSGIGHFWLRISLKYLALVGTCMVSNIGMWMYIL
jgi:hypothetical protein